MNPTHKLISLILAAMCLAGANAEAANQTFCKEIEADARKVCVNLATDQKIDLLFLSVNVDRSIKRNAKLAKQACDRAGQTRSEQKQSCDGYVEEACPRCIGVVPIDRDQDACKTVKEYQKRLQAQMLTEGNQCLQIANTGEAASGVQLTLGTSP